MSYSIEDAKEYVQENMADIMATYENYPDLPAWAKGFERTKQMWQAGCWLNAMLEKHGCPAETRFKIGFCHGQRSAFGDCWKWGVIYLNEYVETGSVADQPGNELADQICADHFKFIGATKVTTHERQRN